jgi:hypothetical protein
MCFQLYSQTEILKWKDGKSSCVSITFDDGTKNQFEIAMPVLAEILHGNSRMPGKTDKEYIQWQRGPLSDTPYPVMTSWIDTTIHYHIWLVLVFHGVEGIGWEALSAETIQNYYNYIKDNEENIWVATFQDGYKYIIERMYSKFIESIDNGTILVELTNNLDKNIYNIPLTMKTKIPGDWKMFQFQQGKVKKTMLFMMLYRILLP